MSTEGSIKDQGAYSAKDVAMFVRRSNESGNGVSCGYEGGGDGREEAQDCEAFRQGNGTPGCCCREEVTTTLF